MIIETWNDIAPMGLLTVELMERQTEYKVRSFKDRRRKVNRYVFKVRYLGIEFRKTKETPTNVFLKPENITGYVSPYGIVLVSKSDFDAFLGE